EQEVEHRIDAATREAEEGFNKCPNCAFGNFKRFRFCTICGTSLQVDSADGDQQDRNPWARQSITARQRRARKRNEWQRKIDVEGNMFWYRSGGSSVTAGDAHGSGSSITHNSEAEPTSLDLPSFVVRFEPPPPPQAQDDVDEADDPTAATTEGEDNPVVRHVAELLEAEITQLKSDLVPSTDADAAVFPNNQALGSAEQKRELIEMANRDFPTKYAQFIVSTASLLVPAEVEFLKLSVHRDYVVEESVDHLTCISEKNMRSIMRINFLDENGVDAGALHREWFMLLNELLADPSLGVFECSNKADNTFYLSRTSSTIVGGEQLSYVFAAGRLVGRALLEGETMGFHLAVPLLKIILGIPVTIADVEHLEPETYRSMLWIADHDGVDDLGLDFTVTEKRGDHTVTIPLVPGGADMAVTDENKLEYLQRKFQYMVFESVSAQLYVFLKGIYEVVPPNLLMQFDHEELDYLLCGSDAIDVQDWEQHTNVSSNLLGTRTLRWFWEVVRDMPNEYKRRLLQFATGCSRVPLVGFKGLTSYDGRLCPFTLKGIGMTAANQYVRSHACFNRLDLPVYPSKQDLETVLYATLETELYGFTTE
ncbi:TPA: hypothetical protein N0F65_012423, partial [Lagenidium giganteum]